MGNSDPANKDTRDKTNFSSQNISDLSQLSIVVAIGLFSILVIFVEIDQVLSKRTLEHHTGLSKPDKMLQWELTSKVILSIAYFGLILLGAFCIINHKFHSLLLEKYMKNNYSDYLDDLKEIADSNWLLKICNMFWIKNIGEKKKSLVLMFFTLIPYLIISILLWFFIAFL